MTQLKVQDRQYKFMVQVQGKVVEKEIRVIVRGNSGTAPSGRLIRCGRAPQWTHSSAPWVVNTIAMQVNTSSNTFISYHFQPIVKEMSL